MSRTKVVVAMSGGVDSGVAAYLLQRQGFEVIGITMKMYDPQVEAGEKSCCSAEGFEDARKVADCLGIAHYVMNFEKIFQEKVITNFCDSYLKGLTPNPCVICNYQLKFSALMKHVLALGAEYLATGHYARVEEKGNKFFLKKSLHTEKDQSYALWRLTQEQLKHTLFPLGDKTKAHTRQIALDLGLPVAKKRESQDICFINGDYRSFITERYPEALQEGKIVNTKGEVLGTHQGCFAFTIGQRKGIPVDQRKGFDGPWYVLRIEPATGTVIIGQKEEAEVREFFVSDWHFINSDVPVEGEVKIRYNSRPVLAKIKADTENRLKVTLSASQRGVCPGQSAVFYHNDIVLGGSIIEADKLHHY